MPGHPFLIDKLYFILPSPDVLRANKATMANGLEARVPFLDKEVLDLFMNVDPQEKLCYKNYRPDGFHPKPEKYILRKAFDTLTLQRTRTCRRRFFGGRKSSSATESATTGSII